MQVRVSVFFYAGFFSPPSMTAGANLGGMMSRRDDVEAEQRDLGLRIWGLGFRARV